MADYPFFVTFNKLRSNKNMVSNIFFNRQQLEGLLRDDKVKMLKQHEVLLLTKEENRFTRLYFAAADTTALGQCLASLPETNNDLVVDILGKKNTIEDLANVFLANGFTQYSLFVRMKTTSPAGLEHVDISAVSYAVEGDLSSLMCLLEAEFDPISAHLPQEEEIRVAIGKGEIQVIRREGEIAGFAFFEEVAKRNIILRYFLVDTNSRMQGFGRALLAHRFRTCEQGTLFSLWVASDNPALKLYEKYNFSQDGLCDYILIRKGE